MNLLIPLPPVEEQNRIVIKIEELLPLIDRYEEAWTKLEDFNNKFPAEMEQSILFLAFQGKLVDQVDSEGTGESLYLKILNKISKSKKATKPIEETEIPFEIPTSWKWARLSEIFDVRDGTHDSPKYIEKGYPLITGKDFYYGHFILSKTQFISENDYLKIIERSKVDVGDILFSMIGGNIGSMIKITKDNYFDMAIKNVALFKQYTEEIDMSDYLYYYLKSNVSTFKSIAKGGTQSFVSLNILRNFLIPLPPLDEQKRIVAKLEELLSLCRKLVK